MGAKFDWDLGNRDKCSARVPLAEIEAVLVDPKTIVAPDPFEGETRYRALGKNHEGRGVFVVFTIRMKSGELWFRPLSVHYVHGEKKK